MDYMKIKEIEMELKRLEDRRFPEKYVFYEVKEKRK